MCGLYPLGEGEDIHNFSFYFFVLSGMETSIIVTGTPHFRVSLRGVRGVCSYFWFSFRLRLISYLYVYPYVDSVRKTQLV